MIKMFEPFDDIWDHVENRLGITIIHNGINAVDRAVYSNIHDNNYRYSVIDCTNDNLRGIADD